MTLDEPPWKMYRKCAENITEIYWKCDEHVLDMNRKRHKHVPKMFQICIGPKAFSEGGPGGFRPPPPGKKQRISLSATEKICVESHKEKKMCGKNRHETSRRLWFLRSDRWFWMLWPRPTRSRRQNVEIALLLKSCLFFKYFSFRFLFFYFSGSYAKSQLFGHARCWLSSRGTTLT